MSQERKKSRGGVRASAEIRISPLVEAGTYKHKDSVFAPPVLPTPLRTGIRACGSGAPPWAAPPRGLAAMAARGR